MGQITLRGIEPKFEKKIRLLAKKSGKSLNRVILDILLCKPKSCRRLQRLNLVSTF
ncbi:MAG: type II toxin-antitoxin system HicB family antitoxin [Deltaproteobacteria bacterium]|nr:type II toxin-antitoxin system HicB family antitoxin [Deltaproteobacteria bacterium]